MNGVRNLPTVAWVCGTVLLCGILLSFTVLSAIGAPTTEIRQFVNTLANIGGLLLGGIGAVSGAYAAVSSRQAARQTNGDLDERMKTAFLEALAEIQAGEGGAP